MKLSDEVLQEFGLPFGTSSLFAVYLSSDDLALRNKLLYEISELAEALLSKQSQLFSIVRKFYCGLSNH